MKSTSLKKALENAINEIIELEEFLAKTEKDDEITDEIKIEYRNLKELKEKNKLNIMELHDQRKDDSNEFKEKQLKYEIEFDEISKKIKKKQKKIIEYQMEIDKLKMNTTFKSINPLETVELENLKDNQILKLKDQKRDLIKKIDSLNSKLKEVSEAHEMLFEDKSVCEEEMIDLISNKENFEEIMKSIWVISNEIRQNQKFVECSIEMSQLFNQINSYEIKIIEWKKFSNLLFEYLIENFKSECQLDLKKIEDIVFENLNDLKNTKISESSFEGFSKEIVSYLSRNQINEENFIIKQKHIIENCIQQFLKILVKTLYYDKVINMKFNFLNNDFTFYDQKLKNNKLTLLKEIEDEEYKLSKIEKKEINLNNELSKLKSYQSNLIEVNKEKIIDKEKQIEVLITIKENKKNDFLNYKENLISGIEDIEKKISEINNENNEIDKKLEIFIDESDKINKIKKSKIANLRSRIAEKYEEIKSINSEMMDNDYDNLELSQNTESKQNHIALNERNNVSESSRVNRYQPNLDNSKLSSITKQNNLNDEKSNNSEIIGSRPIEIDDLKNTDHYNAMNNLNLKEKKLSEINLNPFKRTHNKNEHIKSNYYYGSSHKNNQVFEGEKEFFEERSNFDIASKISKRYNFENESPLTQFCYSQNINKTRFDNTQHKQIYNFSNQEGFSNSNKYQEDVNLNFQNKSHISEGIEQKSINNYDFKKIRQENKLRLDFMNSHSKTSINEVENTFDKENCQGYRFNNTYNLVDLKNKVAMTQNSKIRSESQNYLNENENEFSSNTLIGYSKRSAQEIKKTTKRSLKDQEKDITKIHKNMTEKLNGTYKFDLKFRFNKCTNSDFLSLEKIRVLIEGITIMKKTNMSSNNSFNDFDPLKDSQCDSFGFAKTFMYLDKSLKKLIFEKLCEPTHYTEINVNNIEQILVTKSMKNIVNLQQINQRLINQKITFKEFLIYSSEEIKELEIDTEFLKNDNIRNRCLKVREYLVYLILRNDSRIDIVFKSYNEFKYGLNALNLILRMGRDLIHLSEFIE